MKTKPILFNTEMVKAILDGRKTQTRRVVNKEYLGMADIDDNNIYVPAYDGGYVNILNTTWSKYKVGDVLWVREPAKVKSPPIATCKKLTFKYLADNKITEIYLDDDFDYSKKWIQKCQGVPNGCIKLMARIFLKVTNVRVERLQDISFDDIEKEGVTFNLKINGKNKWKILWNSTSKDGYKWEDNPYIFVYEFERVEK